MLRLHGSHASPATVSALVAMILAMATPAAAETMFAPIGGRSIRIGADRILCDAGPANNGWILDPDGHGARPPALDASVGQVTVLHIASDPTQCAASTSTISLLAVGAAPVVDLSSIVVDADGGEVTLRGRNLRDSVLHWSAGGRSGDDRCTTPQTTGNQDTCAFAIARGIPADSTLIDLSVLPAGARTAADVTGFDAQGRRVSPDEWILHPARVLVSELLPAGASVDTQSGAARIRFVHPEAVSGVDCTDAACDVDANDLVVRDEHGSNDQLEMHMRLRPHVFLRTSTGSDPNPILSLPLQRCPVTVASAPPLRRIGEQNVVLRLGGACARDPSLRFSLPSGPATARLDDMVDDHRLAVVHLDRVDSDELPITVQRGGTVAAVVRVHTRAAPPARVRLELEDLGPIDFIPTNRDARVLLPAGIEGARLVPIPVEGVYSVSRDASGHDTVRGVEGTAGSVAIRLAYRDPSLPVGLRDTDLAVITEAVDRSIRAANVPVALTGTSARPAPLVEMICGDGAGHAHNIAPGITASVPYRARGTCRVILHRERLQPEDGAQAIHLSIDIVQVDGSPRSDARVDQVILLRPAPEPRVLYITGVQSPFDRAIVRATLASDDAHWAIAPDERLGAPQAQWSIVMGTDHFRIYGSTAIPTGLFRVSDQDGRGIMTLNAGALFRLVWLSNEGHESPVGLEAGVMWVGIGGTSAQGICTTPGSTLCNSPLGEVAVVTGVGLSVPIANQGHATQTSINVHAWLEYEVSRAARGPAAGSPIGFVFGPSISIGDVGANF